MQYQQTRLQYEKCITNYIYTHVLLHVSASVRHPQGDRNTKKYKHKIKTKPNIYSV